MEYWEINWEAVYGSYEVALVCTLIYIERHHFHFLSLYNCLGNCNIEEKDKVIADALPVFESLLSLLNAATTTILSLGSSATGTIDGKFDNGYLVTVNLGTDRLKGVLYHIPLHVPKNSYFSANPTRQNQKGSRLGLCDPSRHKSNRSGYNFFFC